MVSVTIAGNSNFEIKPNNSWQDIQAWTSNDLYFALVSGDFKKSDFGFLVHLFDTRNGKLIEANKIIGYCPSLKIDNESNLDLEIITLISKPTEKRQFSVSTERIKTGYTKASRAVGIAIGNNPVAFLIPCHRVIKSTAKFDGYHCGRTRNCHN